MQTQAYAKLNLALDVLGRRKDGYHDLRMVMQSVDLCDWLDLEPRQDNRIMVKTNLGFLPNDHRNLAAAAACAFFAHTGRKMGLAMDIRKYIPVCAGMAGGSSDAAAVLRALNELTGAGLSLRELAVIGEKVGSDVPYCVLGGTALAEGRGERLTSLAPLPSCAVVVCKPPFSVSTPELFDRIDGYRIVCRPDMDGILSALETGSLKEVARRMYNVFEDVLPVRQARTVGEIKTTLIGEGALGACMSGTGPTVFGLFEESAIAQKAYQRLKELFSDTFLCRTI